MPLSFTFEQISNLSYFSSIDFTAFNDFQKLVTIIGFNGLYYVFLILILSICYKVICRICSIIF